MIIESYFLIQRYFDEYDNSSYIESYNEDLIGHFRPKIKFHFFTPLFKTDNYLINLDKYQGLLSHTKEKLQATVKAGTKLYNPGPFLTVRNGAIIGAWQPLKNY